jgi:hypothetical protein
MRVSQRGGNRCPKHPTREVYARRKAAALILGQFLETLNPDSHTEPSFRNFFL